MTKNKKNKTINCCKFMDFYLKEQKVLIFYNPIFREYFIKIRSHKNGKLPIYHCPWCSYKFSHSLLEKYKKILSDKYKIFFDDNQYKYFDISPNEDKEDDFFYTPKEIEPPEEFKSDAWWKKRNL